MSTSDVLDYFNDFEPDHIEWVNDYSCKPRRVDYLSTHFALF